ncbi:hypothetical protein P4631_18085 [Halalkalibacterium halodurans]|uniref:BH1424 protein n=1 Tax=Halalkalibacterium halodurans (strain ATCC BAA-125 / DSM 18197 / FERM 7344 / JCM 9153 / C-125) TaxID=272558 RepID=Q9KCZ5_HALH5|nr:hypothetical protein [Halalkalibacterium halodurans]MED4174320.1 hypothetical protein [Halalkalibacterium halodurans]BAB05143.1 BH1424 [Halalkalibacterium halodurans C-125]
MWPVVALTLFVVTFGFVLGGLVVGGKVQARPVSFLLFSGLFLFSSFFGMLVSLFTTGWFPFRLLDVVIVALCFVFIVSCFMRFHPTFGFFQFDGRANMILFAVISFFLGLQLGMLGWRTFFILFLALVFTAGLFAGGVFQVRAVMKFYSRQPSFHFLPLIWLLFATVLKLL